MSEKKLTGWGSARRQLNDWPKSALITLLKDLYDAPPVSRNFIEARVQAEESSSAALENYRLTIVQQFFRQYQAK